MDTIKTKLCPTERSGCGVNKRLSQFHKNPNNRDGLSNICGECINKKQALSREKEVDKKNKDKEVTKLFYKTVGINPNVAKKATESVQRKK